MYYSLPLIFLFQKGILGFVLSTCIFKVEFKICQLYNVHYKIKYYYITEVVSPLEVP